MKAKASGGWIHGQTREVAPNADEFFVRDERKRPGMVGKYVVARDGMGHIELIWEGEFARSSENEIDLEL